MSGDDLEVSLHALLGILRVQQKSSSHFMLRLIYVMLCSSTVNNRSPSGLPSQSSVLKCSGSSRSTPPAGASGACTPRPPGPHIAAPALHQPHCRIHFHVQICLPSLASTSVSAHTTRMLGASIVLPLLLGTTVVGGQPVSGEAHHSNSSVSTIIPKRTPVHMQRCRPPSATATPTTRRIVPLPSPS